MACRVTCRLAGPDDVGTNFALGVAVHKRGAGYAAESAYRRVLALDPAHAAAMNNRGLFQLRRGRLREAAAGRLRLVRQRRPRLATDGDRNARLRARRRIREVLSAQLSATSALRKERRGPGHVPVSCR